MHKVKNQITMIIFRRKLKKSKWLNLDEILARDAERLLIRLIGLDNLLNSRHGGAGRVPNDTRIGGVFMGLIVG